MTKLGEFLTINCGHLNTGVEHFALGQTELRGQ